jgi:hypothetical protein
MSEYRQPDASSDTDELSEARSTYVAKIRGVCRRSVMKWRRLPLLALNATSNPHDRGGRLAFAYYNRMWTVVDTTAGHARIVVDCETGDLLEVGETIRRLAPDHLIMAIEPKLLDPDAIVAKLERVAAEHLEGCDKEWRAERRDVRAKLAIELGLVDAEPDMAAGAEPTLVARPHGARRGNLVALR